MEKISSFLIIAPLLCVMWSSTARGTEEFSKATGAKCGVCHSSPDGGGALTASGEYFSIFGKLPDDSGGPTETSTATTAPQRKFEPIVSLSHNIRLLTGYVHILVAFLWFGTIFYIHILIGPEKLSSGVPRPERTLGLASMLTVAVTGGLLTLNKIDSFSGITKTEFGKVLVVKVLLFLLMVFFGVVAATFLTRGMKRSKAPRGASEAKGLDLDALRDYDGHGDRPAYVAVDGVVYDVTSSRRWKGGVHLKRHFAGTDLSAEIEKAPHEKDVLERFGRVGKLEDSSAPAAAPSRIYFIVFRIFAYVNLALALFILLCIAFWRWGFPTF